MTAKQSGSKMSDIELYDYIKKEVARLGDGKVILARLELWSDNGGISEFRRRDTIKQWLKGKK